MAARRDFSGNSVTVMYGGVTYTRRGGQTASPGDAQESTRRGSQGGGVMLKHYRFIFVRHCRCK